MVAFLAKIRLFTNTAVATEWQVTKHTESSGEENRLKGTEGGRGLSVHEEKSGKASEIWQKQPKVIPVVETGAKETF